MIPETDGQFRIPTQDRRRTAWTFWYDLPVDARPSKHPNGPEAIKTVMELLNPQLGECALDIGCGQGLAACHFAKQWGPVVAIDKDPAFVDQTAKRAKKRGLSHLVRPVVADFSDLEGEELFDVVMGIHVLSEMEDPEAAVWRAARLARSGGRVAFCESTVNPEFANSLEGGFGPAFPAETLADLCVKAGLQQLTVVRSKLSLPDQIRGYYEDDPMRHLRSFKHAILNERTREFIFSEQGIQMGVGIALGAVDVNYVCGVKG